MIINQLRETDLPLRKRHALPLVLLVAWALLYISTFSGLLRRWTQWDQDLSYGLPVLAIFVYLFLKTLPWACNPPRPRQFVFWLGACAACSLTWLASHLVGITIFEQLMLLPLLALGLTSFFGMRSLFILRMIFYLHILVFTVYGCLYVCVLYFICYLYS